MPDNTKLTYTQRARLPPNMVFFQINRFRRVLAKTEKITRPVPMPDVIPDGPFANWELRGFIYHIGDTAQSGHYETIVRTDSHWYIIANTNSEQDVKRAPTRSRT